MRATVPPAAIGALAVTLILGEVAANRLIILDLSPAFAVALLVMTFTRQ